MLFRVVKLRSPCLEYWSDLSGVNTHWNDPPLYFFAFRRLPFFPSINWSADVWSDHNLKRRYLIRRVLSTGGNLKYAPSSLWDSELPFLRVLSSSTPLCEYFPSPRASDAIPKYLHIASFASHILPTSWSTRLWYDLIIFIDMCIKEETWSEGSMNLTA